MFKLTYHITISLLCFAVCTARIYAQPANAVYADRQTSGGTVSSAITGTYSVTGASNAINATGNAKPNNSFAQLSTSSTLGISTAWLQLGFANDITSSATAPISVYIKVSYNQAALLNGGLAVTAYDKNQNAVNLLTSSYNTYYTPDGNIYISVTPTATFRYVRTTLSSPVALGSNSLQIYYAFYGPTASNTSNPYPFSASDCGQPNVSTKSGSGGLALGTYDVANAGLAIDNLTETKSSFISEGLALLSGHIKQTFFFNGNSNPSDAVRVILSQSASLLAVNLASAVTLRTYSGNSSVGQAVLVSSLLNADLLGLLSVNNRPVTFYFAPKDESGNTVVFDRVEIDLDIGLLGVGLGSNGLNIHDVRRAPDVATAPDVSTCSNIGTALLSAISAQAGIPSIGNFNYFWYPDAKATTPLSTLQNWTIQGLSSPGTKEYFVEIKKSGTECIVSPRKKITVSVIQPPLSPAVALKP